MTDPLYNDEAVIRSVTYSTNGGHKVSFELDPEGWERLKGMETTRCAMVLVPITNEGQPDVDAVKPERPKRRMNELSRAQQAGILCNEARFAEFLEKIHDEPIRSFEDRVDGVAAFVRKYCMVNSRSLLNEGSGAMRWDMLKNEYDAYCGRTAKP